MVVEVSRLSNGLTVATETIPNFVFRNAAFAVLDEEKQSFPGKQIGISSGPGASRQPYLAKSFFNISENFRDDDLLYSIPNFKNKTGFPTNANGKFN